MATPRIPFAPEQELNKQFYHNGPRLERKNPGYKAESIIETISKLIIENADLSDLVTVLSDKLNPVEKPLTTIPGQPLKY